MDYKSQNNEAEVVANYFSGKIGNVLDIGANDGITFSNSYDLIQTGWGADLIEPTEKGFVALSKLYDDNEKVGIHNYVVASKSGLFPFCDASDSLLATSDPAQLERWKDSGVDYKTVIKQFNTFADAKKIFRHRTFDFITIDAEGMDLEILQQMDLKELGCQCICIEHNSTPGMYQKMKEYCEGFGLTEELLFNGENVIMAI